MRRFDGQAFKPFGPFVRDAQHIGIGEHIKEIVGVFIHQGFDAVQLCGLDKVFKAKGFAKPLVALWCPLGGKGAQKRRDNRYRHWHQRHQNRAKGDRACGQHNDQEGGGDQGARDHTSGKGACGHALPGFDGVGQEAESRKGKNPEQTAHDQHHEHIKVALGPIAGNTAKNEQRKETGQVNKGLGCLGARSEQLILGLREKAADLRFGHLHILVKGILQILHAGDSAPARKKGAHNRAFKIQSVSREFLNLLKFKVLFAGLLNGQIALIRQIHDHGKDFLIAGFAVNDGSNLGWCELIRCVEHDGLQWLLVTAKTEP